LYIKIKVDLYFVVVLGAKKLVPAGKFWVSAMSLNCPKVTRWCNGADNPFVENTLPWKKGEPTADPEKECVVVDFVREPPYFENFSKVNCWLGFRLLSESIERYNVP